VADDWPISVIDAAGGLWKNKVRFAPDSLLEGDGFELPVPRKRDSISSLYFAREIEDREFAG
jgi:hypothetical protein